MLPAPIAMSRAALSLFAVAFPLVALEAFTPFTCPATTFRARVDGRRFACARERSGHGLGPRMQGDGSTTVVKEGKKASAPVSPKEMTTEIERRRTFAIISHPDAGKTTMTEKLLLYGGALQEAGAVKAKGERRRATSDFMQIEQDRGISISSTALQFEYDGKQINLLDTPGHQDFSEDTYRTIAAADNALMLLDGAKGLEAQTLKLFDVVKLKRLPLFTFINKMDRPSLEPLELLDTIEQTLGVQPVPMTWPIGSGDRFQVSKTACRVVNPANASTDVEGTGHLRHCEGAGDPLHQGAGRRQEGLCKRI